MSFLLVIVVDHLAKAGADFLRIVVGPFMREGAALVGLHGVDAAEFVVGEPRARAGGTALENQPSSVGRDFRLVVDEILLRTRIFFSRQRMFHPTQNMSTPPVREIASRTSVVITERRG